MNSNVESLYGGSVRGFQSAIATGATPSTNQDLASRELAQKILVYFLLALPLVALGDIPSDSSYFLLSKTITASLLFLIIILPIRHALSLLLIVAVVGGDGGTSTTDIFKLDDTTASIWLFYLGPIRPSWILFSCIMFQFLKLRNIVTPPIVKRSIVWFATVPFVTGLFYDGLLGPHASIEVIVDLKFVVMLVSTLLLFLATFRRYPEFYRQVLAILIGTLLARHAFDLIYVLLNLGPELTEGVSRGSLDSAKGAVIFLAYFGTTLFLIHKRWILGAIIASVSIFLLAAYGTRMLWVTFAIGMFVLSSLFTLHRKVLLMCVATALFCIGGWFLTITNPETAEVVYLRFQTITEGREAHKFAVEVEGNVISRIDPIRYGEILNILSHTARRFAFAWGSGYGAAYDDSMVRFPDNLASSFPEYSFSSGRFYRAHDYVPHIFFKFGLIGLYIISALWFVPGAATFRILRRRSTADEKNRSLLLSIMRCVVAFLATSMLQLYWSGKGLFLSGVFIAICIEFLFQSREAQYASHEWGDDYKG